MEKTLFLTKTQLYKHLENVFDKNNYLAVGVDKCNFLVATTAETKLKDIIYNDNVTTILATIIGSSDEQTIIESESLKVLLNLKRGKSELESKIISGFKLAINRNVKNIPVEIDKNNMFVSHVHEFYRHFPNSDVIAIKYTLGEDFGLKESKNYYALIVENNDYRKNIRLAITHHTIILMVGKEEVYIHNASRDIDSNELFRLLNSWFGIDEKSYTSIFLT